MPKPRTANLNDLMSSYFSRAGEIMNITLANGANTTGPVKAEPVTDIEPDEAVGLVVSGRLYHQLVLSGTFVATVHFEASVDGTTYFPLVPILGPTGVASSPDMTTAGFYLFQGIFTDARLNLTAWTSGSVNADLRSLLT